MKSRSIEIRQSGIFIPEQKKQPHSLRLNRKSIRIVFQLLSCGMDIQGRWHGITEGLTQWKCRKIPAVTEIESGISLSPYSSHLQQIREANEASENSKPPVKQKRWKTSYSSPVVSRSLTGCFAQQNIGEVARSDVGVSSTKMSENIREIPARRRAQILQSPYTLPLHR